MAFSCAASGLLLSEASTADPAKRVTRETLQRINVYSRGKSSQKASYIRQPEEDEVIVDEVMVSEILEVDGHDDCGYAEYRHNNKAWQG